MCDIEEQTTIAGMDILPEEDRVKANYVERIDEALSKEIQEPEYKKHIHVINNKGYIAIKTKSYIAVKIIIRKNSLKIEVDKKYADLFENADIVYNENNGIARITAKDIDAVLAYSYQLSLISIEVLAEFAGEGFGCCGYYVECSDAKQCIHPDKLFARACAYRRNLENGRIFYGKNKNI